MWSESETSLLPATFCLSPTLLLPALAQPFDPEVVCGTDIMVLIRSGVNLTAKRLLAHINFAPEVQAPNERVVMKIIYLQGEAPVTPPPPWLPLLACPSYCTRVHTLLLVCFTWTNRQN